MNQSELFAYRKNVVIAIFSNLPAPHHPDLQKLLDDVTIAYFEYISEPADIDKFKQFNRSYEAFCQRVMDTVVLGRIPPEEILAFLRAIRERAKMDITAEDCQEALHTQVGSFFAGISPINLLSDYALSEIFAFLGKRDLPAVAGTCQRFFACTNTIPKLKEHNVQVMQSKIQKFYKLFSSIHNPAWGQIDKNKIQTTLDSSLKFFIKQFRTTIQEAGSFSNLVRNLDAPDLRKAGVENPVGGGCRKIPYRALYDPDWFARHDHTGRSDANFEQFLKYLDQTYAADTADHAHSCSC